MKTTVDHEGTPNRRCAGWGSCEQGFYADWTEAGGVVRLGTSPEGWCLGNISNPCGSSNPEVESPPECACACDEAWPGV